MDPLEYELSRVPSHWPASLELIESLDGWLTSEARQVLFVAEEPMVGMAAWGAAVMRFVTKSEVWGGSSKDFLNLSSPPLKPLGQEVLVLIARSGGGAHELQALEAFQKWYPKSQTLLLSDLVGQATPAVGRAIVNYRREITDKPSLYLTRFQVQLMSLCGRLSGRAALCKRAGLLGDWYLPPAAETIRFLAETEQSPLALWTGAKIAGLCYPMLELTSQFGESCRHLMGPSGLELASPEELILAVTSRPSESEEFKQLKSLREKGQRVVIFSTLASPPGSNVPLSPKCTDIGRSIHSTLSLQLLLTTRYLTRQQVCTP